MKTRIPIMLLATLLGWLTTPAALADYKLDWHTVDNGGERRSGGNYTLQGTIAQPEANTTPFNGGNYQIQGGFWVKARPYVELSVADVAVTEGNAGTTTAQLTVNLNKPSHSSNVTLNYATADDTAKAGSDYTAISTTPLTFAAGETRKTIEVTVNSDSVYELTDETFFVNLSQASYNAKLIDTQAIGTITEDDSLPSVTLSLSNNTLSENGGTTTVTASLSNPSTQPVTVDLGFSGADNGTDYTVSATTISIPAGELSGSVTITGQNDSVYESDEAIIAEINSVTNGTEDGTQQVTASLIDDETTPTLQFASSEQNAAENAAALTITLQLSAAANLDIEVPFSLSGTATETADYTITASPITLSAGTTTANITITPVDDSVSESAETVIVTLGTPTNAAAAGTTVHTATLTDNEAAPTVQFTLASQTEAENVGSMTITAQLSTTLTEEVTIPFTVDGTATEGTDYSLTSSPITLPAGSTTADITLTVNEDNEDEPDETVTITLGTPTNATATGTTAHTATIEDNDISLVLNEIDYNQGATDTAEFIELKNVSGRTLDLTAYAIQLINSNGSSDYQTIGLSGQLAANDYYVICANNTQVANCAQEVSPDTDLIQDGSPQAITLIKGTFIVDTVSYDGNTPNYTETAGAPADSDAQLSLSRYADGTDTNNNSADLGLYCLTPGAANSDASTNCGTTQGGTPSQGGGTTPSQGGGTPSQGGGTPSQGGGTPSQGDGTPSQGDGTPSQGGGTPSQGDGTPSQGGGTPSQGGGTPSQGGGGTPSQGGGTPSQGGGTPSQGGGTPSQGGGTPSQGGGTPSTGETSLCPTSGTLNNACRNADGKTITDSKVEEGGHLSNGILESPLKNQGLIANLTITPQGTVEGGKVTGHIKNKGTMKNFVFVGASLIGGKLEGDIKNTSEIGGYFQDIELGPNTQVEYGILKGKIRGDNEAPARLKNLKVEADSQLSGVVICEGVQLSEQVSLGDGVSFCKWEHIPTNLELDLTTSLPSITPPGEIDQPANLDLDTTDVAIDDKTILEAINELPELADYNYTVYQHDEFGDIRLDIGGIRFAVNIKQLQHRPEPERLQLEVAQTFCANTNINVEVLTQPAIQEPEELQKLLADWNLPTLRVDNTGNLQVRRTETDEIWYSARPNWASEVVEDEAETGLFIRHLTAAFLVYTDEDDQKREQLFYPAPAQMSALLQSARQVDLTTAGILRFTLNGTRYEGLLDFLVIQGEATKKGVRLTEIADTNDDGLKDFLITYPNGAQQVLWRLAPESKL